jgi:hypothetical protein
LHHHHFTVFVSIIPPWLPLSETFSNQVDVLEVQFSELLKALSRAHDFDSVRRAHDLYLSHLAQDCFLLHKV